MRLFAFIIFFIFVTANRLAAQDTLLIKSKPGSGGDTTVMVEKDTISKSLAKKDSAIKKKGPDPRRATIYSAIFPGAGQFYNKKYWKIPIVLAAVGIPTGTYFYNKTWYNRTRYALAVLANGSYFNKDSVARVNSQLLPFIFADTTHMTINPYGISSLEKYRNYFRSNEDYSVLFFLLFYGLNIVDATVDAHLKLFDVDRDLSIRIGLPSVTGSNMIGLSFFADVHSPKTHLLDITY